MGFEGNGNSFGYKYNYRFLPEYGRKIMVGKQNGRTDYYEI
jgi:hypothetical protein